MEKTKITQDVLNDFSATLDAKSNLTTTDLLQKFPEFGNDENLLQAAVDYHTTSKSGKYKTLEELNSKFPEFGFSPKQSAPSQGAESGFQGNAPLAKPSIYSDYTGKPTSISTSPSASTSSVGVGSKLKADQEQTLKSFAFNKEKALRDAETVKTKEPVNYAKAVVDYNNLIGDTEKKLGYQVDKINSINSEMNSKFNRVNIPSLHPELAAEKNRLYNEKIKANQEYNKLIASRDAMIQKKAQFQGVITDKERKEAQERIDNPFIANFLQSLRSGVGETVEGMKNMGLDDLIPAWMNPEVTNPENFKKQAEEYTKDKKSLIQALEEKAVIDESKVKVENEKREELGQAPIRSYLGQTLGGLTPALLIAAGATATGTIEALPAMNASLFGTMGYGASLAQGYNEARNLGYDKEESYELAKNAARVGGTVQGILGMVMGQAGEALGGLNPYNKAITGSISKNAINQGITDFALKAVGTGAEFSGARVAENIGQKYLNPDLSADKNVLEGGLESFGQGLLLHTTMSAMNAPKQILGKASLINAVSEARSSEDVSDILNTIQESKQNNFITEGMATQLAEKVGKVREAINLVPDSFTDKDVREKATDLILKHQAIEEKLKKTPEGLKPMVEEELKAINVQFEDLRNEQLNKDKEVAKEPTPTEPIDYSQSDIVNNYIDSLQRNIDDEIEYEGQKKPRGILGKIADFFTKDDSTYLDNLKDELKGFKENPIKALENRIARYKKYNEKYPDDAYDLSGIEQDLEDLKNYGKVDMEQSMEAAPTEESKGVGEDTQAFTTDAKFKSEPIELSIEPSRVEEPTEASTTETKPTPSEESKAKKADIERRREELTTFSKDRKFIKGVAHEIQIQKKFGIEGFGVDVSNKADTSTGFLYSNVLSEHFDTIEEAIEYANQIIQGDKEYIKKVDAELAKLKTDETEATKNKEASVPSKQAASGEDTIKGEQQKAEVVEGGRGADIWKLTQEESLSKYEDKDNGEGLKTHEEMVSDFLGGYKNGKSGISIEGNSVVFRNEKGEPKGFAHFDKDGIREIGVDKSERGSGIASKMLNYLKQEKGIDKVLPPFSKEGNILSHRNEVKKAIADGRYEKAIENGDLTQSQVDEIVKSAGLQLIKETPQAEVVDSEKADWSSIESKMEEYDFSKMYLDAIEEIDQKEKQKKINQEKQGNFINSVFSNIDNQILENESKIKDWQERKYKKNDEVVYEGGDDIHGKGMSISAINEGKRQKKIKGFTSEIESLNKAKEILKNYDTSRDGDILDNIKSDFQKEDYIRKGKKMSIKEEMILDDAYDKLIKSLSENKSKQSNTKENATKEVSEQASVQGERKEVGKEKAKPKTTKKEVKITLRQERINTLVGRIDYYNNVLGKGKGNGYKKGRDTEEGRELLNEINAITKELGLHLEIQKNGITVKYKKGGSKIRATYGGNKIGVENHLKLEQRNKSTQELFHTLNNAGQASFPIVRGYDGRKFSPKQIAEAISDVVNGHNSILADSLLNTLETVIAEDAFEVENFGKEGVYIPLSEIMKHFGEKEGGIDYFTEDIDSEQEVELSKEYDEWFNNLSEQEKEQELKYLQDEGTNDTETESESNVANQANERTKEVEDKASRKEKIAEAKKDFELKQRAYDKAKSELEKKGMQDQVDIFGATKGEEMLFKNDLSEQRKIVDGLKKEAEKAKEVLAKLESEQEVAKNQLTIEEPTKASEEEVTPQAGSGVGGEVEEKVSGLQHTKSQLEEIAKEEGIDNAIASFKKDLSVKENRLAELTKYEKGKLPSQKTKTKEIQSLEKRIEEVRKDVENLEKIKVEQSLKETPSTEAKTVEQLRAEEQAELDTKIPNAEKYRVDGKVERSKLTNDADRKVFDEVYDRYDKLITPLLKKEGSAGVGGEVDKSILKSDVDLKGDKKKSWMRKNSLDRISVNDINEEGHNNNLSTAKENVKAGKKSQTREAPLVEIDENGNATIIDGHHRIAEDILNGKSYIEAVIDNKFNIRDAIKDGLYEKAISEGRMTAKDAKEIIESAGLEVPKDISEQTLAETPKAEPKVEPTPEKVQESKVEQQYQEAISKKSERAKNNAKEKFINDNFDKIVSQLMLENKIKRKC